MKQIASHTSSVEHVSTELEPLAAEFPSESDLARRPPAGAHSSKNAGRMALALGGVFVIGASALFAWRAVAADTASIRIESDAGGVPVEINGQKRGTTPLLLALAPGDYAVRVGDGEGATERRITLAAQERASIYHVASPTPGAAASVAASRSTAQRSALAIITEPAGGIVSIDDVEYGAAPLVAQDLPPGEHRVVVRNQGYVQRRSVSLAAGATSTLVVSGATQGGAGWITARSPLALEIREGGRLVGTTAVERLMLTAGQHQLEFVDNASGFRLARTVRVDAGATTTVTIDVPRMPVNVNATPWGEVWIDGERIGETPIGNHMLTVGEHRVEVRHPELGTKSVRLLVALDRPNRLAVNMRER